MKSSEVFKLARKKIEEGWCREAFARDKQGNVVAPCAPNACSWCFVGAVDAVALRGTTDLHLNRARSLLSADKGLLVWSEVSILWHGFARWNDEHFRTKEDVLVLYDRIIAEMEKRGE